MMFPLIEKSLCSPATHDLCGSNYLIPQKAIPIAREMYPESDAMAAPRLPYLYYYLAGYTHIKVQIR